MAEKYTAKKWTLATLQKEAISRGFDEADVAEMGDDELRAQLISDDNGEVEEVEDVEEETNDEDSSEEGDDESDEDVVELEKPKANSAAKKGDFVDIARGEQYIRTYSAAVHGKEFRALAESFASKKDGYSILEAGVLQKIKVTYRIQEKKGTDTVEKGTWLSKTKFFTDRNEAIAFMNSLGGEIKKAMFVVK